MLLTIALAGGIRHAFDADHVMTLAGFNQQFYRGNHPQTFRFLAFCLHWSMGHGGILLVIGSLVLIMGMAIPNQLAFYAESACALLLMALGSSLLFGVSDANANPCRARQGQHLSEPQRALAGSGRLLLGGCQLLQTHPRQSAISIGLLHGLSGSASILALLPLMNIHSVWQGMLYLLCFGVGVSLGMLLFATSLNFGLRRFLQNQKIALRFRRAIGIFSIVYGIFMLWILA